MKLRILRDTITESGSFRSGNVVVISGSEAENLIKSGRARVEDGTPWVPGAESKPRSKPKSKARAVRKVKEIKPKTQIEPDPISVEGSMVVPDTELE